MHPFGKEACFAWGTMWVVVNEFEMGSDGVPGKVMLLVHCNQKAGAPHSPQDYHKENIIFFNPNIDKYVQSDKLLVNSHHLTKAGLL